MHLSANQPVRIRNLHLLPGSCCAGFAPACPSEGSSHFPACAMPTSIHAHVHDSPAWKSQTPMPDTANLTIQEFLRLPSAKGARSPARHSRRASPWTALGRSISSFAQLPGSFPTSSQQMPDSFQVVSLQFLGSFSAGASSVVTGMASQLRKVIASMELHLWRMLPKTQVHWQPIVGGNSGLQALEHSTLISAGLRSDPLQHQPRPS